MARAPKEHPPRFTAGTKVGDWRVEQLQGHGAYGAVYRAVRVSGQEESGPFALKTSLHPWDARFVREAELLSRLSLPGVPRLLDRGVVHHPSGEEHFWFVMEWVEGTPSPSGQQLCRVLAQLARTLEALHASGVVHRDISPGSRFPLVMGQYPPPLDAVEDAQGAWHVISPDLRSLLAGNPRVGPRLREVILRLLSEVPEARGTAEQAATELEAVANERVPQQPAEPPPAAEVAPPNVPAPPSASERPEHARPPAWTWARKLKNIDACGPTSRAGRRLPAYWRVPSWASGATREHA